jgi:hypothetical protein
MTYPVKPDAIIELLPNQVNNGYIRNNILASGVVRLSPVSTFKYTYEFLKVRLFHY